MSDIALYGATTVNLVWEGDPQRVAAQSVTPGYFALLGVEVGGDDDGQAAHARRGISRGPLDRQLIEGQLLPARAAQLGVGRGAVLEVQLRELLAQYTPKHPDVVTTQRQLESLYEKQEASRKLVAEEVAAMLGAQLPRSESQASDLEYAQLAATAAVRVAELLALEAADGVEGRVDPVLEGVLVEAARQDERHRVAVGAGVVEEGEGEGSALPERRVADGEGASPVRRRLPGEEVRTAYAVRPGVEVG